MLSEVAVREAKTATQSKNPYDGAAPLKLQGIFTSSASAPMGLALKGNCKFDVLEIPHGVSGGASYKGSFDCEISSQSRRYLSAQDDSAAKMKMPLGSARAAVESHPSAQNALGWGSHRPMSATRLGPPDGFQLLFDDPLIQEISRLAQAFFERNEAVLVLDREDVVVTDHL